MKEITFNKGLGEWYCGVVVDKWVNFNLPAINYRSPTPITTLETAISNTSTSGLYLSTYSSYSDKNLSIPPIIVDTATGHIQKIYSQI